MGKAYKCPWGFEETGEKGRYLGPLICRMLRFHYLFKPRKKTIQKKKFTEFFKKNWPVVLLFRKQLTPKGRGRAWGLFGTEKWLPVGKIRKKRCNEVGAFIKI